MIIKYKDEKEKLVRQVLYIVNEILIKNKYI